MNKKLSLKNLSLVSFTLFGMFFGAGNLIFPVHLGQLAGNNILPAIIGFVIGAVGIPVLGVIVIGKTHSSGLQDLASRVSKRYGTVFTCLLYLTIGPLFAIPRCATTSYTTGIEPLVKDSLPAAQLLFSALFFALVFVASLKSDKITFWIGKIINPVFLLSLLILLTVALCGKSINILTIAPSAEYASAPLFKSLTDGYSTMDGLAGLAFGIIVIEAIRGCGVTDSKDIAKESAKAGLIAGGVMAALYALLTVVGALSLGYCDVSENGGIALSDIAFHYFGGFGSILLAVIITFATLKTSIGLICACSETFSKMTHEKISYRTWVLIFTLASFAISNVGLTSIINYSLPVLMLLYPCAITLIILGFFEERFGCSKIIYATTMAFVSVEAALECTAALPASLQLGGVVDVCNRFVPLFSLNLGWILFALCGFLVGFCAEKYKALR